MMTSIPESVSNYIKIALLVLRISQRAVRVKFDFELHPKCLQKTLNKHGVKLKDLLQKNRISQDQWGLLFPPKEKGEASSKNFDITLMMCLIRNLTEIQIGNTLPQLSLTSLSDDLTRINFYRNRIAHVQDATINDTDFSKYWDDITQAIIRMGGEVFREECVKLEDKEFNTDESDDSLRHIQTELKLAAVENKLVEVTDRLSYLEGELNDPITKNKRDLITVQIEEWKSKDTKLFVKTERSEYVFQRVEVSSCVVLTGGPGVGKTSIARHIALMLERNGYRIIPVVAPEDIRTFYQHGKRSVFIVDDLCGTYTAKQGDVDNWQQLSPVIKTILSDKSCKIIAACRLQVFLDEKFKLLSPFKNCECNVTKTKLRKREKKQMINRYNISTQVLSMESQKCEFFPLLCSLYRESESVDAVNFFKHPFEIFQTELDSLSASKIEGKYRLCGLALCVLFNNKIEDKWFQSKRADYEETMLQDVYGACRLDRGTSKELIGEELRTLEGTYVCKQNETYTVLHDMLFDCIVYFFGQKMLQCLIEHGDSYLIRERFIWQKSAENIDCGIKFITEIPYHLLNVYLDRLIKDWFEGRVSIVFYNINLKDKLFREKFLQYLERLDKTDQEKLANTMDTMFPKGDSCSGNYPIIDVCFQGYDDILQWLLKNEVNVNQSRDDGVTALIMASYYGYSDIVTMLLKHDPDVNLFNEKNVTALYMACQNNHNFVVEKLLKTDIDVDICDGHGISPLFIACRKGCTAIVKLLLQKSPNVDQISKSGYNPLHIACLFRHTDVVTLLLMAKNVNIDANARDANGYTPLVIACFQNFPEISSLLISAKADVNIQAFNGASALCFAIGHGHLHTTRLLLENNASLQTGFKNRQQIMDALPKNPQRTLNDVQEEIQTFFVKNASPKVKEYVSNMSGDYCLDAMIDSSPLHIACLMGHRNIAECLLNLHAYVDFTKEDGTTPLFFACELGHSDIVRLLLDKGADVNIRRLDGKSSSNIAEYNGHQSIVAMLREHGADCHVFCQKD
ncbi:uncharacterized protein LOC127720221 [Mytilus californianus]|uniref:uncharacterized protein LOC127720221 n=1 Tax=Mytilus californianus TaxID=6549 RepID=UPI0022471ED6|nr:uncharacterized protein LOC127720221 [Mytilus californianus]